ncbi:hypothetical protein [Sulfuricurvum sp.]|uniref:capsular polysaccharide export protein, LipB/KpsS family n=1 Tax=Sulfuricurvum sp. TaxID=2025608 RepID=UPI002629B450|nr:hypothetical protein [Sulfuricurvum sp.]MDD2781607.1 hypothetical protein [Sulfuricurvum sp.]
MIISFSRILYSLILPYQYRIEQKYGKVIFIGWGRRRYGEVARKTTSFLHLPFVCIEDGFVRSMQLGQTLDRFSIVVDDIGIYYDATRPSRLEILLNSYDFASDHHLMKRARKGMEDIVNYCITKYNHVSDKTESTLIRTPQKKVLIIAQTLGDMSLHYGYGDRFSTQDMLDAARNENPDSEIYIKIHPDVLHGIKQSDIDLEVCKGSCTIITQDTNPITLLKDFDVVYTKTSQMGFEALMLGKKTVCFGAPFYSGWGLTDDRVLITRRNRVLRIEELFAAAYLLYPLYYDPYTKQVCEFEDVIQTIVQIKSV